VIKLAPISAVADINPRQPPGLAADTQRAVSFVPMAAVSEEGILLEYGDRPLTDVLRGYTYFERNDILVAKITPCFENGKAALCDRLRQEIGFASTEFHVLRPREMVHPRYLFYAVWNPRFRCFASTNMTGSAGQRRVPKDVFDRYEIPLSPLPEQRRIAAILDKADAIRRKRRETIRLLDDFLRSVFLDMFGDPVTNSKGWPTKRLSDVGMLDRGISKHRPRNAPELLGGDHPLIQTGDVANSGGYIRHHTQTYSDVGLKQSKMWPSGTLCITIAANIAKTGILTFDACFPDSVVGFTPVPDRTTTEFVQHWLSFLQRGLEESAPESAQKNINLKILRSLEMIAPPVDLQERFSATVRDVENTRLRFRDSGELLCEACCSLGQSAFKGGL